jgi:hypothetical protein
MGFFRSAFFFCFFSAPARLLAGQAKEKKVKNRMIIVSLLGI